LTRQRQAESKDDAENHRALYESNARDRLKKLKGLPRLHAANQLRSLDQTDWRDLLDKGEVFSLRFCVQLLILLVAFLSCVGENVDHLKAEGVSPPSALVDGRKEIRSRSEGGGANFA
jgi:hypothetical protein